MNFNKTNPYLILEKQGSTLKFELEQPHPRIGRDRTISDCKLQVLSGIIEAKHNFIKYMVLHLVRYQYLLQSVLFTLARDAIFTKKQQTSR